MFLGEPRTSHKNLYEAYPSALGYSGQAADESLFEAILILALYQASKDGANLHKVYILVPARLEKWAMARMRTGAERVFARLKKGATVPAIKHVGAIFHQLMLGFQIWALPEEPKCWVAFGFSKTDHVPEWMRSKLLETPENTHGIEPGV
jgi:hypothetical protein